MSGSRERETPFPDDVRPGETPRWKRDFPIDRDEDEYVARRDFTKFLILTSGAFVVGQGYIATKATWFRRVDHPSKAIVRLDELRILEPLSFTYPEEGDACVLVRLDEATLTAFDQRCTHLSCPVVPDLANERFTCPCHVGHFDLRSGRPLAGPPRRPLARIVLDLEDGMIHAVGREERT